MSPSHEHLVKLGKSLWATTDLQEVTFFPHHLTLHSIPYIFYKGHRQPAVLSEIGPAAPSAVLACLLPSGSILHSTPLHH